jgi:hypothetical protein
MVQNSRRHSVIKEHIHAVLMNGVYSLAPLLDVSKVSIEQGVVQRLKSRIHQLLSSSRIPAGLANTGKLVGVLTE